MPCLLVAYCYSDLIGSGYFKQCLCLPSLVEITMPCMLCAETAAALLDAVVRLYICYPPAAADADWRAGWVTAASLI